MKDRGTPISLFSFQDIITSLTGIMIIVILVIALQMLETVQQSQDAPPPPQEYTDVQKTLEELKARLHALENQQEPLPEEWLEILNSTPEAIEAMRKREEARNESLKKKKQSNQKTIETLKEKYAAIQEKLNKAEQELKELQQSLETPLAESKEENKELEKKLAELKDKLARLLEEERKLVNAIAAKRKKLEFSFVGERTHTPILVECKGNSFRAGVYLSKDIRDFSSGDFDDNLNALCKWLKGFDFSHYYPVLLYRESAIQHCNSIEGKIKNLDSSLKFGKDPISNDISVF